MPNFCAVVQGCHQGCAVCSYTLRCKQWQSFYSTFTHFLACCSTETETMDSAVDKGETLNQLVSPHTEDTLTSAQLPAHVRNPPADILLEGGQWAGTKILRHSQARPLSGRFQRRFWYQPFARPKLPSQSYSQTSRPSKKQKNTHPHLPRHSMYAI